MSTRSIDRLIGERIRARRTALGLTQEQLATGLGLSYQQIQKYESGASRIAAARLPAMAARLDVPIGYFFDASEEATVEQKGPHRTALELSRALALIESEPVRVALAALYPGGGGAGIPARVESRTRSGEPRSCR